jgi:septal ring factor EnvC (AmiA/AmiB activator)
MTKIMLKKRPVSIIVGPAMLCLAALISLGQAQDKASRATAPTAGTPDDLKTHATTVEQLNESLGAIRVEIRTDQVEIGTMKERLLSVHKEIQVFRSEIARLSEELKQLKEESKQLRDKNQQLRSENQQLRRMLALQTDTENASNVAGPVTIPEPK